MQIQKETKLFAFKLAEKKEKAAAPAGQWQVRDGVSVAGCTKADGDHDFRFSDGVSPDNITYC